MAYENVRISTSYPNFCLSPRSTGEFGYIDHDNDEFRIVRISDGQVQQAYTLSSGISEIKSLEYVGPRGLGGAFSQLGDELPFFTLEHISSSQCKIKKWYLGSAGNTFDLQSTITLSSASPDYFDSYAMAVENYETTFSSNTTSGTGQISITSIGSIEIGDELLLGPSGDTTNLDAFEYVTVTGVVGSIAYLDASKPQYEYSSATSDPITYWKNIYLFSDRGQNNDATKGSLYTIYPGTGTVTSGNSSAIYNGVIAASWSRYYQNIAFVKGTNLLYLDYNDYEIKKSHALTNINADETTVLPVYDIALDDINIYRLQLETTRAAEFGGKTTTTWTTYNYQLDTTASYTKSIAPYTSPAGIMLSDLDQITLYAVVRDQYGAGLSGLVVTFDDSGEGTFTPIDGQDTTDANGLVSVLYDLGDYGGQGPPDDVEIAITIQTLGGVTDITGHDNVWDGVYLLLHKNFRTDIYLDAISSGIENFTLLDQIEDVSIDMYMDALSKFTFPGGHWVGGGPPSDSTIVIEQLGEFTSDEYIEQLADVSTDVYLDQDKDHSDDFWLSQLYVSRHAAAGHHDSVDVEQFRFVDLVDPDMFSVKNPVNSNIRIRLLPFGFSLNSSTLVFKVREVSYAGDTGYVDVTALASVSTFDAGGGLLGLDILYNPVNDFHHKAVVYVSIEVYDTAAIPNILLVDYWFKIIPDFRAPYIINENPDREEEDVAVDTNISFGIRDAGVGVDISTLELYVNNRRVTPTTTTTVSGGYNVEYDSPSDFHYGQTVEITVKVQDASEAQNILFDMWRFYCVGSTGPWIDPDSFYPRNCTRGTYRKLTGISANVYAVDDAGLDRNSIMVTIGGKDRNVIITPIIYRVD